MEMIVLVVIGILLFFGLIKKTAKLIKLAIIIILALAAYKYILPLL